jgi:hypothetical protein
MRHWFEHIGERRFGLAFRPATLDGYAWLYNQQLPQSALGSTSPLQALKDWHTLNPKLFKKMSHITFRDVTRSFPPSH